MPTGGTSHTALSITGYGSMEISRDCPSRWDAESLNLWLPESSDRTEISAKMRTTAIFGPKPYEGLVF